MAKGLRALGYPVGRHQARGLMRETGVWIRYRRRYRVTTNSNHRQPVFENRLKRGCPECRQPGLGRRHQLRLDPRGLAVPGRGDRSVLAQGGRLIDGQAPDQQSGLRCAADGAVAAQATQGSVDPPFGSGGAVRQPRFPKGAQGPRDRGQHEPKGRLLGARSLPSGV